MYSRPHPERNDWVILHHHSEIGQSCCTAKLSTRPFPAHRAQAVGALLRCLSRVHLIQSQLQLEREGRSAMWGSVQNSRCPRTTSAIRSAHHTVQPATHTGTLCPEGRTHPLVQRAQRGGDVGGLLPRVLPRQLQQESGSAKRT